MCQASRVQSCARPVRRTREPPHQARHNQGLGNRASARLEIFKNMFVRLKQQVPVILPPRKFYNNKLQSFCSPPQKNISWLRACKKQHKKINIFLYMA